MLTKNSTTTYNYISGAYLLAGAGGATFGSLLLSNHVYLLNFLSILCFALTACTVLRIPNDLGLELNEPVSVLSTEEEDLTLLQQMFGEEVSKTSAPVRPYHGSVPYFTSD